MVHPHLSLPDGLELTAHYIAHKGRPVAILNPATLVGLDESSGSVLVQGPRGRASLSAPHSSALEALTAAGCILLGSEESVLAVSALLDSDRWSRTTSFFCSVAEDCDALLSAHRSLRRATVSVLGCGGIGALAAVLLAGAGIGTLILVDHDTVAVSNLNRQIFWTRQDAGRLKTSVLCERIRERFDDVCVRERSTPVTAEAVSELAAEGDGCILTADEPIGLARSVRDSATAHGKHVVSAGYLFRAGIVACDEPGHVDNSRIQWTPVAGGIMPSYGPTNAEVAGVAASLLILKLAGLPCSVASETAIWDTTAFPRTTT